MCEASRIIDEKSISGIPLSFSRKLIPMIVLINGSFVSGKTTTAELLVQRLYHSMLYDPEVVGAGLASIVKPVWVTHIVPLGGYLYRSHRENLMLPVEAYSPFAWWSTMDVNRRGHEVGNSYSLPGCAGRTLAIARIRAARCAVLDAAPGNAWSDGDLAQGL